MPEKKDYQYNTEFNINEVENIWADLINVAPKETGKEENHPVEVAVYVLCWHAQASCQFLSQPCSTYYFISDIQFLTCIREMFFSKVCPDTVCPDQALSWFYLPQHQIPKWCIQKATIWSKSFQFVFHQLFCFSAPYISIRQDLREIN